MRQEHVRKSLAIFLILVLMTGSSYTSDFSIYAFQDEEDSAEIMSEDNYVLTDTTGYTPETDLTMPTSEPDEDEDSLPDGVEDIANGDDVPDVSGNDTVPSDIVPDSNGMLENTPSQPDSGDAGLVSTQLSAEVSGMEVSAGGDMPEDADLLAYTIGYAGQYEQTVSDTLGDGLSFHAFAAFDISIVSSGEYWQPSEDGTAVDISIDGLDLSELSSVSVFRIEGEEVTDMEAESTSDTVRFETDHFTVYVVGEVSHDTDTLGVTASGTWLGLSYTIYDDGLCVVTGTQTGEASYSSSSSAYYGNSPWYKNSAVTSLYLDYKADGKKQYGMFRAASHVTNVSFGNTFDMSGVTNGEYMFYGCSSLTSLTLPDGFGSAMKAGSYMLSGCNSLTSLTLPDGFGSVMTSGHSMFKGCSNLTSLTLPDGFGSVMTEGRYMFSDCSSLTSLTLPDGFGPKMTDGSNMFSGCSSLTSLTLPDGFGSVMTGGSNMFNGCSSLNSLTLPDGFGSVMKNGHWMFSGCSKLQILDIHSMDLTKVTSYADFLYGCTALEELKTPAVNPIADIALPKTLYSHPDNTAYTNMPVTTGESVALYSTKDGVYTINEKEYAITDATTTTTWLGLDVYIFSDGMCIVTGTQTEEATWNSNYDTYYGNSPLYQNDAVTSLYLDYNADGKSQYCIWRSMPSITDVQFGNNFNVDDVTNFGDMFNECSSLSSISLPDGFGLSATNIGYMFRKCSSLISISMPEGFGSKATNGENMFLDCKSLTSITLPDGFGSVITNSPSMFSGCSGLTSLTLPHGFGSAMTNGSYMFRGCSALASLALSDGFGSMITNGVSMFDGCSSLTNLTLPDGFGSVMTDGHFIFLGCRKLESVSFTEGFGSRITNAQSMFYNCKSLKNLNFPNGFGKEITNGLGMFCYCSNLTDVNLPEGFGSKLSTTQSMFYGCYNLSSVELPNGFGENLTDSSSMFNDCGSLTSIDLPEGFGSTITNSSNMFKGCSSLNILDIHSMDMTNVTSYANFLSGCTALEEIKVPSTNPISDIALPRTLYSHPDNTAYTNMPVTNGESVALYSVLEFPTYEIVIGDKTYRSGDAVTRTLWLGLIVDIYDDGMCIVKGTQTETASTLSSSSTYYGKSPWYQNSAVTSLYLDYKADGKNQQFMFCYASYVTGVSFGDTFDMSGVTDGSFMFAGCSGLTSLSLPDGFGSVMKEGGGMFAGCSGLTSLTLPDGFGTVMMNGSSMFYGCSGLTSLTLPEGFSSAMTDGGSMFYGCSGLTGLTMPGGFGSQMTEGGFMFYGCSGLTGLTMPGGFGSQMTGGTGMFAGCSSLISLDLMSTAEPQVGEVLAPVNGAVFKTSSTSNISGGVDNGSGYGDNTSTEDTVTVEGAEKLYVELVCQTEGAIWDYLTVCDSTGNDLFGSLGGKSKFTKAFTVTGDSVTFRFCSDSSSSNYYGYYAKVYDYADCSASEGFLSQIPKEADLEGMLCGCCALEELRLPRANSASFALPKFMYTHPDNRAYCAGVPRTTGESITLYGNRVMDSVEFSYTYNGVSYGREDIVDFWYIGNDSGTHGELCLEEGDDNITLYLLKKDDNCILYAKGSGRMADYAPGGAGWCLCETVSLATDLVLDEGILNIGAAAFYADVFGEIPPYHNLAYGYTGLRRVSLPESICSIGMAAFYGCTMLEGVDIPSGVTELPNYAFTSCTNLLTVSGGENLTNVASGAFLVEAFPGGREAYLEGLRSRYANCSQAELDRVLSYAETCFVDSVPVDTSLIGDSDYLVNTYDWASDNRRIGISYAFVFSAPSSISLHTANDDFATESSFMIYGLSDTLKRPQDYMVVDIQVTDALTNEGGRDLGMYFVDVDDSSCRAKHLSDDSTQLSYLYGTGLPDEYTETFEIRVHDTVPDSRDMFTGAITFVTSTYTMGTGGSGTSQ